ncbi:hypothetical protein Aoki45_05990 [Algoriphagus sp. oki45]|uniref:hypothetical protein n=1 Tax=Algoriphagus sp. oki45 TaxID=3067294 RepID=UPI0027E5FA39|nr:hypothetical protein Aoki45_05990 [Algoriphagus sp. oki45]
MIRRLAISFLSLSWVLGFCSFFLLSTPDFTQVNTQQEVKIQSVDLVRFSSTVPQQIKVEIPTFKIDWNSFGKFNAEDLFRLLPLQKASLQILEEQYRPKSLFDVKITFLHFFFTW